MDKTALITGGGKGIGEAIALALGRQEIRIAVAARTADVERVATAVREVGGQAWSVVCDVTNPCAG